MATITHDDLWFCDDCTIANVNGDFTGLDNLRPEDADRRLAEVTAGMEYLATLGYPVADDDPDTGNGRKEFSAHPCDCCEHGRSSTRIAGSRTRFAILGK